MRVWSGRRRVSGVSQPYPPIEPYASGTLETDDGHRLYWEACGNPDGTPALVLHGGPGSGCTPAQRRLFDPERYRVVLFDQRGSGRSSPHASEAAHDFGTNTTEHLLGDIERLRESLGIDRWVLFGGSWGSTLALAYAERWPGRVRGIVLGGVTMTRRREIDWLCRGGLSMFYPAQWARFERYAREHSGEADIVAAYHGLVMDPDPAVHGPAAQEWCRWESAVISPHPGPELQERFQDERFALGFVRVVTHYFKNDAWLEPDQLLRGAGRMAGIPGVLIHGRLDMGGLETPWLLHRVWPGSELRVVEDASHSIHEPGMTARIVAALDALAEGE